MKIVLCFVLMFIAVNGTAVDFDQSVDPEYLDKLRAEGRHEEFSKLMGIPNSSFVQERDTGGRAELPRHEAMLNKDLQQGDIMPFMKQDFEEGRQGIRHEGNKWPNRRVPYVISGDFNGNDRQKIEAGIHEWNRLVGSCIQLIRRSNQRDYVYVFSGNGCWSYVGKTGQNRQSLSLQKNGCLSTGTILHEFNHAIGIDHEQCRYDRDNFIEMLWHNIEPSWRSAYEKNNPRDFQLLQNYDYYSIMHYAQPAPGSDKPAFRVKQRGVDGRNVGRSSTFTRTDMNKIRQLYGCRRR